MMSLLLLTGLMSVSQGAQPEFCAPAATTLDLEDAIKKARAAADGRDARELQAQVTRATQQLGCLADPPDIDKLFHYHVLRGVAAYQAGQVPASRDALATARALAPEQTLRAVLEAPPASLRRLWDGLGPAPTSAPPVVDRSDVLWNGQEGAGRPAQGQALYQRRENGCVVASRLVGPGEPTPDAEHAPWAELKAADLDALLGRAQAAVQAQRADELALELNRVTVLLPCMGERVQPEQMASYYLLRGMDGYQAQGPESAQSWFSAARGVAPDLTLGALTDKPGAGLQAAWDQAGGQGSTGPALSPLADGASRAWDGRALPGRPQGVPTLYQRLDAGLSVELTQQLQPGDPLPPETLAPVPSTTTQVTTSSTRPDGRRGLGIGFMVLGAVSGGAAVWQGLDAKEAHQDALALGADGLMINTEGNSENQSSRNKQIQEANSRTDRGIVLSGVTAAVGAGAIIWGASWTF